MRRIEVAALGSAACAASVFLAFWPPAVADYAWDAGPTLHPLVNGHLSGAFAHQPAMGWVSILVRAPFAFFARHGGSLLEYRLGAVPCVLAAAALGLWLAARMRGSGRALAACALVVAFAVLGPMNWHALFDGHPEEILGGVLCVVTVLMAGTGRNPLAAGAVLGLALATKQWAVLAAGPALLAAPRGRGQLAAAALAVGGALTLAPVLAGAHQLLSPATSVSRAGVRVQPASIWWPLGHPHSIAVTNWTVHTRTLPPRLANLTHPLIVALGALLPLLLLLQAPRRREASTETALTMLALLFLLRCALDPLTVGYYHVPLLLSLLALEALHRRGLPLLTLLSSGVLWLLVVYVPWGSEPAKVAAIYLAWALPVAGYLAARLYAPRVMSDFGKWLSSSLPPSLTSTRSSIRTPNAPGT
jgi:hypothetical protein